MFQAHSRPVSYNMYFEPRIVMTRYYEHTILLSFITLLGMQWQNAMSVLFKLPTRQQPPLGSASRTFFWVVSANLISRHAWEFGEVTSDAMACRFQGRSNVSLPFLTK
jgi:hypothetical protein